MFLELWSGFFEMWYLSFWNVILVLWNVISVFVFKYGTCFFKCVIVLFLKCDTFFGNVVHLLRCDTAFSSWKLGRIQNLRNVSRYRFKHKIKVPFNKRSVPLSNSSYESCRDQFLFVNQLFVNKLRQKNRLKSWDYWYLYLS